MHDNQARELINYITCICELGIKVWLCIKRTCNGQAMSKGGRVLFDTIWTIMSKECQKFQEPYSDIYTESRTKNLLKM